MDYRILGPLEVVAAGRSLPLGGLKQRALLAILLLNANRVVSVDALMEQLWGEEPPETAPNIVQTYISRLRRVLEEAGSGASGSRALTSRSPGYVLIVKSGELDLERFETGLARAREALDEGDPGSAAKVLFEALSLWRGPPLADFAFESFAQRDIERLDELRLAAQEDRIEADLALGRGGELASELQALVAQHPLRERPRGQLMVALYRSGRQAEALESYHAARRALSEELGIDPGPDLQRLERAILNQDPSLLPDRDTGDHEAPLEDVPLADHSILVAPRDPRRMDALLSLAEPLARSEPPHDLLIARLLGPWERTVGEPGGDALADATEDLNLRRRHLGARRVASRVVAFNSEDPAEDLARLAEEYPVDLLLVDGEAETFGPKASGESAGAVLERVQCDVAVLLVDGGRDYSIDASRPVIAPFGGAEHDWAALQLAAWIARSHRTTLRLLGSAADLASGRRDASRLLGRASLIVQQVAGVVAEPVLVEPGPGVAKAARGGGLIVMGVSERWREEGLGPVRGEIAEVADVPVLALKRGKRSGAVGPQGVTRFTWSRAVAR